MSDTATEDGQRRQAKAKGSTKFELGYWGLLEHLIEGGIRSYGKLHKGVRIEAVGDGARYIGFLEERFVQNKPPDFFQVFNDVNAKFQARGWSAVLEDYIPEAAKYKREISNPQYLKSIMTPDGRVQALVYYGAHAAFMYNKKHIVSAGFDEAPKEWDDVITQASKLKARGISDFPIALGLSGPGYVEAAYSLMLGMSPPQSSYLFDDDLNPIFDDRNSPLYVMLRWLLDAVHKHKVMTKESVRYNAFDATYAMGQFKHTFSWLPRYVLPIINFMSMSRDVSQAMNPGYGYTSCYTRIYAPSMKALLTEPRRREELWKAMQYFGGKTDDRLEPDLKNGKFRVLKAMALDAAIPSPVDDLWKDEEYCAELARWGPLDVMKRQDKKVYNALCDPWPASWYMEWADQWGRGPFKVALHSLIEKGGGDSDILATLHKLAREWRRLRHEHQE